MLFYPDRKPISFKLIRFANHIGTGGAELNHIRTFVSRVPDPTPENWLAGWTEIAAEELSLAEAALAKGHKVSARDFFQRASGYFRESGFYLEHKHPSKKESYVRSRDAFHAAMPLMDHRIEHVNIPWKGLELPGYLALPNKSGPVPTIVFIGGADATKEEVYFTGGKRLLERGFAVLMLDGPGQGESRVMKGINAAADWDTLGQPIFDSLASRPEIDANRIGLLGISMGGYYAPKIASGGAPFKCLAVWGACFDVLEDLYIYYPHIRGQLQGIANVTEDQAQAFYADFNLKEASSQIRCPVLITHGTADMVVSNDAAIKFDKALSVEHDTVLFEGAIHCMYDRPATAIPIIFDWLEDHLQ